jgi:MerR family transcriptional regulator, light-induced transcriptional regulator
MNFDAASNLFLVSLLGGNRSKCSEIVNSLLEKQVPLEELYELVIRSALYEIGRLWEQGVISVAAEHQASAIVEAVLNEQFPRVISVKKNNKSVVLTCVENEFHQIGIKMVSDVFELNGWNSHFLGANTPLTDLITFSKNISPNAIAISTSLDFHLPDLERTIRSIQNLMPEVQTIIGGQAMLRGGLDLHKEFEHIFYFPNLKDLELHLKSQNEA